MNKDLLSIDFGTSYCAAAYWSDTDGPMPVSFGLNLYNAKCYKFPTVIQYALDQSGTEQKIVGQMALSNLIQSNRSDTSIVSKIKTELRERSGYLINGNKKNSVDIVSDIFFEIKKYAELCSGRTFSETVITHPAQYESTKQTLLIQAAMQCGFRRVHLIEEPKAAAYAFCKKHQIKDDVGCIVFDYGGGTIDVAYLQVDNGNINFRIPTKGKERCGGEYIDILLHNHVQNLVGVADCGTVIPALLENCSHMKINFDSKKDNRVVFNRKAVSFSDSSFQNVIEPKTSVAIKTLQDIIDTCTAKKLKIDYIFMNGGSSRLHFIRQSVKDMLPDATMLDYGGDDIAVAVGALLAYLPDTSTAAEEPDRKHVPYIDPALEKIINQYKQKQA